jgi:hypothetical protein
MYAGKRRGVLLQHRLCCVASTSALRKYLRRLRLAGLVLILSLVYNNDTMTNELRCVRRQVCTGVVIGNRICVIDTRQSIDARV